MDDNPLRPGGLQLTKRALSYCRFSPGATLLDVGCGKGTTVKYLREQHGLKALGLDISSALWSGGYDKHGAPPLLRASGERLPFLPRTFDGVFAECSLSVIGNPSNAIKESHRVLQRGGLLVVTDLYARVPERLSDLRRLPMTCCLTGAFLRDELIAELAAVGFSMVLWEDHSYTLKHFAAQLIFSYGSLQQFWHLMGSAALDVDQLNDAVATAKPGYFPAYCTKEGRVNETGCITAMLPFRPIRFALKLRLRRIGCPKLKMNHRGTEAQRVILFTGWEAAGKKISQNEEFFVGAWLQM